jgi:hypothetical protein
MYMKQCHYFSNPGFSKASYLCEDLLPGALVYREFVCLMSCSQTQDQIAFTAWKVFSLAWQPPTFIPKC